MTERFVHLHVHSDMSQLDGCARVEDYVKAAAERGDPALALTDHGTMRGALLLTAECEKRGIKPIYGVELYVCEDMNRRGLTDEQKAAVTAGIENKAQQRQTLKAEEERRGIRKLDHLTVWALDNDGLRNLYRLTTKGWTTGFYYKPRVDLQALAEHHQGLAVGTGCLGSVVYDHVVNGRPRLADSVFGHLNDIFTDRLFLEVQPHELEEQRLANEFALLVRSMGKHRLLATQDAHYLQAEAAEHHDVLLAIEAHEALGNPDRFRFRGTSYWFKTREEMAASFAVHHPYMTACMVGEALATTVELAQQCKARIKIDPLKCLLPEVQLPDGFKDPFEYLVHLVTEAMHQRRDIVAMAERYGKETGIGFDRAMRVYIERLQHELKVLRDSGFASYFLVIHDLYQFAEQQGIAHGPGRGSAAGSLVSFLLGITDIDPIEHRLLFERFIAPGRINMPDVDCDFADARRGEIVDYLKERYGADRVAQISTVGRMAGRQALKDVSRVYEVPFQRANVAASTIGGSEDEAGGAIQTALERSEFLRGFQQEYPEAVRHAQALEGLAKSLGVHPAGVVASPVPLMDVIPLETRRTGGKETLVTAYDMRGVEDVGLLKIDVLGLRAVTVLEDARRAIGERDGKELVYAELPLGDRDTLQGFTERDFVGVFQFDTPSSYSVCDGLEFMVFDDIAVVNAINRPGALAFADEFKRRRADPSLLARHLFHPKVSAITADALGLMVYQEHVIKIAVQVAGFTPAAADKLRKKIAKSAGHEALEENRQAFVEGCKAATADMSRDDADRLFDAVVKFGRYGFNRSHSVCYSMLAYWMMWLKKHRPLEFYWAIMAHEGDPAKIQRFARDAKLHGVETLLPDVNVSGGGFTIDYEANAVRGSLMEIKGVGEAAVSEIVGKREAGPYTSLLDFLQRARGKKVTKKTVGVLAQAGALDSLLPNPRWFVLNLEKVWKDIERKREDQVQMALERSAKLPQWSEEERLIEAAEVNPLASPPHPLLAWEPWFATNVKVPLSLITPELMTEERNVYVAGVVVEMEQRLVGDTKSIAEFPDKAKQKVLGWGEPWVRFTVEDVDGGHSWVKLDWSLVPLFQEVVDQGEGALVMVCARTRPDWQNLDAHFIADLRVVAQKLERDPGELSIWERLFVERYHPAMTYPWESKADRRLALLDLVDRAARADRSLSAIGVISHLYLRLDRRGKEMAFFGIAGLRGYLNVVCFASAWEQLNEYLKPGVFARFKLVRLDEGGTYQLDVKSDAVRLLEKGLIHDRN